MAKAFEKEEALRLIAEFIRDNGIDNFNVRKVREFNSPLQHYISNKMNGFKQLKREIACGYINLDDYLPAPSLIDEDEAGEIITDIAQTVNETETVAEEQEEISPELNSEAMFQMVGNFIKMTKGIMDYMERIVNNQEVMANRLDRMVSIPTAQEKMQEKLQVLEEEYEDDVRERCIGMIHRYAAVKYGSTNTENVRKAYKDVYAEFNAAYNVNLDAIQIAWINITNRNRIKNGKKPIDYINPNVKGVRKIDIIERLGMLVELYVQVKHMLEEVTVEIS